MDSTNGALSAASEMAVEVPSSAAPEAVEADQPLTSQTEEGKAQALECNGNSGSAEEAGSFSHGDEDGEDNTLERAVELFEKGSKAIEDGDFVVAVDSLSRALEIRVANYGELAPECTSSYYKYGCALLYKAQEETDPLGDVHKNTSKNSVKDAAVSNMEDNTEDGETSMPSSDSKKHDSSPRIDELEGGSGDKNQEDGNEGSEEEDEELGEAEEDDSDLDLAWKMLDIARAIVEKNPEDSIEKVNVFAALGEVSMEREDVETSLSDYRRALAILEHLVEPDNRRVVEINFRICLVLELGSKVDEAASYCEKAISLCKSRLERLRDDSTKSKDSEKASEESQTDLDKTSQELSSEPSKLDGEIDVLSSFATELEKKLEDLQQLMSNPKSILTELLKRNASTSTDSEKTVPRDFSRSSSINSSQMAVMEAGGFDSPTISTAANDGVTHLGVVGRGIKRAIVSTGAETSLKKSPSELSAEKADSCISEVLSHPQSSESSIK